ncbi:MAG: methyl-accepting chemotaxis protein [Pseudomonadota bacterium]
MLLRNINIALRAALGFGAVAMLVFLMGSFALLQMGAMHEQALEVDDHWLPASLTLNEMGEDILRVRALTLRLLLNRDPEAQRSTETRINQLKASLDKAQGHYETLLKDPEEKALYQRFKTTEGLYLQQQEKVMALSLQGALEEAKVIASGPLGERADQLALDLKAMSDMNRAGSTAAATHSETVFVSSRNWVIGTIALSMLLTIALALLLTRSIVTPLDEAVKVAEVIASGNLTQNIRAEGQDEPARLLGALRSMQQSLRSTIQSIKDSSTQLASASEELSAVTEDATRGLHQQNTEIEQAATAVNEMTAAVDEVARNAVTTSAASRESDQTARHGREQVIKTVDSIDHLARDVTSTATEVEQLADKVRDISKVLDVIRSIAEQTNLLALNAAIEAARAGDAGRGFAVVADEVRALAHRTQQSTREIEQMVSGIQQGTDKAVSAMQSSNARAHVTLEVAQAAGKALDQIAVAIGEISERNLVIASASEQQAQVVREVDRNLVNIRDLALQTSAGADQTSASSQALSRLAIDLNNLVMRFTI